VIITGQLLQNPTSFYVSCVDSLTYVVVLSRLPQIIINFKNQSTGQLSFLSFLLSFAGYAARLGTVLVETEDWLFRAQHITGTMLTGALIAQFILYWKK
jgi:mannose-P-dolichol utilization defect 1